MNKYELNWFALHTYFRREKLVAEQLEDKGIKSLVPLQVVKRQWSDRVKEVAFPLFPGYIFVEALIGEQKLRILQTKGVVEFVQNQGVAIPIPEVEMHTIHTVCLSHLAMIPHPYLKNGEWVKIITGPLRGLCGILLSRKSADKQFVVSVGLIQRSVAVEISGYDVEPFQPLEI